MNKTVLKKAYSDIENLADKMGEIIYDEFNKEDNFTHIIGKDVMRVFCELNTEEEFLAADGMLVALCGWRFESLVNMIKERDEEGYSWESI